MVCAISNPLSRHVAAQHGVPPSLPKTCDPRPSGEGRAQATAVQEAVFQQAARFLLKFTESV